MVEVVTERRVCLHPLLSFLPSSPPSFRPSFHPSFHPSFVVFLMSTDLCQSENRSGWKIEKKSSLSPSHRIACIVSSANSSSVGHFCHSVTLLFGQVICSFGESRYIVRSF